MTRLLFCCAVLASCGPKPISNAPLIESEDSQQEPEVSTDFAAPALGQLTEIPQPELLVFLDKGPAHLLGLVDVAPTLEGKRFTGWGITDLRSPVPLDLRKGDVILRVNDNAMMKPTDLAKLYLDLRTATVIEIELSRDGSPMLLSLPVIPAPST